MTAPDRRGHYVNTKQGPTWVGSTNGLIRTLQDRITRAHALLEDASAHSCDYFDLSSAIAEALNILEES